LPFVSRSWWGDEFVDPGNGPTTLLQASIRFRAKST
jgi:hypothetical protein